MRNNILKTILALALIYGACNSALAQIQLPENVKVALPERFSKSRINKSDLKAGQAERRTNGRYWTVYSDRDDNPLYKSSGKNASKTGQTLSMGQKVKIAKIESNYALVYSDGTSNVIFPQIGPDAKALGWVPMENLLLWPICPVDEFGIYEKALIVANLDKMDGKKLEDFNKVRKNPDSNTSLESVSSQHIFFIMKDQKCADGKTRYLLSLKHRMEDKKSVDDYALVGWIEEADFVPWNQRSCLEQNTKRSDLQGNLKGTTINVYSNSNKSGEKIAWWDVVDKRPGGDVLRFPVLANDSKDDKLYKITYFGAHKDANNYDERMQHAMDQVNKAKDRAGHVNLILVIDATTSMKAYYEPVKNVIQTAVNEQLSDFNVKVGVVLYRDKVDDYPVEYCPVEDIKKGTQWTELLKGGKGGIISGPRDRTQEEDMITGLETALDFEKMKYDPNHQNVLLLVGDCGNERDDAAARMKPTIDKLIQNNIQLLVFQVNASTDGAYGLFRSQSVQMLFGNIKEQSHKLGAKGSWQDMGTKGRYFKSETGKELENLLTAVIRYPDTGTYADPNVVGNMLNENLVEFVKQANNTIMQYELMTLAGDKNGTFGDVNINYIKQHVSDPRLVDFLINAGAISASTGYVEKKNSRGVNIWDPVIFISQEELASLLGTLKEANNQANAKNNDAVNMDRNPYVNALRAVVESMVGDIGNEKIGEVTLEEITQMIAGLNVKQEGANKSYSLNQLLDSKIVSDTEYRSILADFRDKYMKLNNLQKKNEYKTKFGKSIYHWIPISMLP